MLPRWPLRLPRARSAFGQQADLVDDLVADGSVKFVEIRLINRHGC